MEFDYQEETATIGSAHVLQFRANLDHKALNINREDRTIDNVILAKVGEARGHGVEIEQSFIEDMNRYVRNKMTDRVQCNYGHQWDSLGFQLGAFSNLRVKDNAFVGKLKVYKAADKSPEMSGVAEWFFDLAEEDPKAVMCSIKFVPKHYYQYDEKGQVVIIRYSWWSGPEKVFENKPAYVAFKRLMSCDIVDEGALTESLFSANDDGAARMLQQIVNAPGFKDFMRDNHEHFPQLSEFYKDKFETSFTKFAKSLFSKKHQSNPIPMEENKPAAPPAAPPAPVQAAENTPDINALIEAAVKPLRDQITALAATNQSQAAKIVELEKKPAADPVQTRTDDPARVDLSTNQDGFMNSPMNRRVAAMLKGGRDS